MKTITLLVIIAMLPACGTMKVNRMAQESYQQSLEAYAAVEASRSSACATAAAGCIDDMCRVATLLACNVGGGDDSSPRAPQLRYPSQDALAWTSALTALGNVAVSGISVWQSNKTNRFITESNDRTLGGIVDSLAGSGASTAQSIGAMVVGLPPTVGGDQITIGGDNVGRDQIGRDQIEAGQIGDRGDVADDGGIINSGDFRQGSPGPISDSGNDNSENSGGGL